MTISIVTKKHVGSYSKSEEVADSLDRFNKPRYRQRVILDSLVDQSDADFDIYTVDALGIQEEEFMELYSKVHSVDLLEFLLKAWRKWVELGKAGRDHGNFHPAYDPEKFDIPPLVLSQVPLHHDRFSQRAGNNVMGQVGYYCTDICTPIVETLLEELNNDCAIVQKALELLDADCNVVYALTTHPGHHASFSSYGGYCFVNQAAMAARMLQEEFDHHRVAVLDIDYHAGNGTVSIFYEQPILVVSIHCDPAYDYPFNSGYADQCGVGRGEGYTLNIPLPPGTKWESEYRPALIQALSEIRQFEATALVVSLGLDTYEGDAVTMRRAGFKLSGEDYRDMGGVIHDNCADMKIIVVQEGGYKMDVVGRAVTDFLIGLNLGESI